MNSPGELRVQLKDTAHHLAACGMVAGSDGNLSVKSGDSELLVTPSGLPFDTLRPEDMISVDFSGMVLEGIHLPTSELPMHLRIYHDRPDVSAVVHAHPPYATAFAVAGRTLEAGILPELELFVGNIELIEYALPGSTALADRLAARLGQNSAFLLANHGLLTVGSTLEQAWRRHQIVEHAARIFHLTEQLGGPKKLRDEERQLLNQLRQKLDAGLNESKE